MVFVEVLSWFAFYSSPIPDQTGHSQACGLVRSTHINIPYYIRSIEYHSQSGLWAGGFQERENVLSLVRDGHDACPQGLRVGTCALLARRLDSALARLCECESNFSTISRDRPLTRADRRAAYRPSISPAAPTLQTATRFSHAREPPVFRMGA